jgi:hypothetical protein
MMFALTWLPEVLEAAGLKVAETPNWRTRGRGDMGKPQGIICHHTGTPRAVAGNMPTLGVLINGRAAAPGSPSLTGPLAQLGLGRDGTFYVIAAGRANHAGPGQWLGLVNQGNSCFLGIEAENSGAGDTDPWPEVQLDAYWRGCAAILKRIGATAGMCCGHKEYATPLGRKSDPNLDMAVFRSRVAGFMQAAGAKPGIPAQDAHQRPTLRRGSVGADVAAAQALLQTAVGGPFNANDEARLRALQRDKGLVPDGILGPASWQALDARAPGDPAAPVAQAAANQQAVEQEAAEPVSELPVAESPRHAASVAGAYALGPDGRRFATRSGPGFVTNGTTSLADWLDGPEAEALQKTQPALRVVRAVSANEGCLEAVNSYDGCFLSFGIFQWTAGAAGEDGELAVLLQRFRDADAGAYDDCFGRYGLMPDVDPGHPTGALTLSGHILRSAADKAELREPSWAYRFWRAGHHPALRLAQLGLATSRIGRFAGQTVNGRMVADWLSSELGMALMLDEHVNRPGHVPGTLGEALRSAAPGLPGDPALWTVEHEHALIVAYLAARQATTMTDSSKRASRIMDSAGPWLDTARGSFTRH